MATLVPVPALTLTEVGAGAGAEARTRTRPAVQLVRGQNQHVLHALG